MAKKFFITTAIDYVNSFPHLGHALEKIQTDVIARYRRLLGEEVFFLTGTDENSLKNVQVAKKEKIRVEELVERNAQKFYQLKEILNLSFDDFIRTTEKRHIEGAQKLWLVCQKDIYKKSYQGLYCVGCEEFYKEDELIEGKFCPEHKKRVEKIEEKNYFFRLSKYEKKLKKIIERNELKIVPEGRKNEILSFIEKGLEDICVSRSAERASGWGIDVPGDRTQKIWVWFDALSNYINAVGYSDNEEEFKKWWPADLHVIGKGILRFHALYWPAILLSAKLPLPKKIFVHGYITVSGQKMSKSLGNIISPSELVKRYGTDALRYFLLREIPPSEDGDFTYEKFEKRYNSDLAKGLGNLTARIMSLILKFEKNSKRGEIKVGNLKIKKKIENVEKKWKEYLEEFKFHQALDSVWELISFSDKYIQKEKPWLKSLKQKVVISNLKFLLSNIAKLLRPFLPQTSEKILAQLKIKKSQILFPKLK